MRGAFRRVTPTRIALIVAGLVVIVSWVVLLRLVSDCLPSMRVSGSCGPLATTGFVPLLAIEGGVVFALVFALAFLVRTAARFIVRVARSLRHRGCPLRQSTPGSSPRRRGRPSGWSRRRWLVRCSCGGDLPRRGGHGLSRARCPPPDAADFGLIRQAWDLLHAEYVESPNSTQRPGPRRHRRHDDGRGRHWPHHLPDAGLGRRGDGRALRPSCRRGDRARPVGRDTNRVGRLYRRAGGPGRLQTGDRIIDIDGRSTLGVGDDGFTQALEGSDGSEVTLTVERAGADEPIVITVTRGVVPMAPAWAMVPGTSVALLRIDLFSDGTADELARTLADITASKASGIVLDLRGNPGGAFNEGVWVASEFLASGTVVQGRDRAGVVHVVPVDRAVVDRRSRWSSSSTRHGQRRRDRGQRPAGRRTGQLVGEATSGTGTILTDSDWRGRSSHRHGGMGPPGPVGRCGTPASTRRRGPTARGRESAHARHPAQPVGAGPLSSGGAQLLEALQLLRGRAS